MSNAAVGMEIRVDPRKCMAYGICVSIAPDLFDLPAGAKVVIALKRVAAQEEMDELEEAVRNCPACALSIGTSGT